MFGQAHADTFFLDPLDRTSSTSTHNHTILSISLLPPEPLEPTSRSRERKCMKWICTGQEMQALACIIPAAGPELLDGHAWAALGISRYGYSYSQLGCGSFLTTSTAEVKLT